MATNDANATGPMVWVLGPRELGNLIEAMRTASEVVCDLETTGLDEYAVTGGESNGGVAARIVLAAFTLPQEGDEGRWDGETPVTYILPLSHPDSPWLGTWRKTFRRVLLEGIVETHRALSNQNVKFDARWCWAQCGVDLSAFILWDSQVSSHLLDETITTRLKERVPLTFPGVERWDDFDLTYPGAAEFVPLIELGEYGGRDTWWTWRLIQDHRIDMYVRGGGYPEPVYDLEPPTSSEDYLTARLGPLATWVAMPTVASLTRMEQNGFRVDTDWVKAHRVTELARREEGLDKMAAIFGQDRDRASTQAASKWFKEFTLQAVDQGLLRIGSMTKKGNPQWNKGVLGRQARNGSETAALILDQRGGQKSVEFLSAWLAFTRSDGKIHCTYNAGKVSTGRLSSNSPNMQQVSKKLRPAFIASDGYYLADFDFSQIELRVAAYIARCLPMIEAFNNGEDLHQLLGAFITQKLPEDVTADERQKAKCFSLDTEVLTPGGWKLIVDLVEGEKVAQGLQNSDGSMGLEWVVPKQVWSAPNEHDHLVRLKSEGIDLLVTPDHGMVELTAAGKWRRRDPHEMNLMRYWPNAGTLQGERTEEEALLRVAVAVQADGSYTNTDGVRFGFTKQRKVERLAHLLEAAGITYRRSVNSAGVTTFRFRSIEVRALLSSDKTLPWAWLDLTIELRQAVLDEAQHWDGTSSSRDRAYRYLSQVQKNIDVMQALAAASGRKTHDYGDGRLTVRAQGSWKSRGGSVKITRVAYTGLVACLSVDSTTVLVRRAGVTVITHQSANFGLLYLQSAGGYREYAENVYGVVLTPQEAARFHAAFFERWEGMHEWHESVKRKLRRDGLIVSPVGRVRRLSAIWDNNAFFSEEAERQGVNSPVQGLASDLMQLAAADIQGLLPGTTAVPGVRLVATVHDSIVAELPVGSWRETGDEIARRMERSPQWLKKLGVDFDVPIVADFIVGTRWSFSDISDPD